ncbi:hypothetical protein CW745_13710 [Psychromonas sp. psych-6C06]|uniref:ethylbenzene dehydrogenase-related protein n=1 Tax=Psychromonas sp. psych-6C06 TaxID=2058089 RepID=UPI000C32F8BD|nr:ethylbenzene dehydrogenase-related protein [Psychromonas sp. psych-6C06]PKF60584.1 hypothetical protein CW745_13710 [Psychromonas sp. psych-6C06]
MQLNSKRYNFMFLHIICVVAVLINLLSGSRIRLVSDPTLMWLSPLLPQGQLHQLHLLAGIALTAVILIAPFLNTNINRKKSPYHRWINRLGYVVIIGAVISGWLSYFSSPLLTAFDLHYFFSCAVFLYILLHGIVHLLQQGKSSLKKILPLNTIPISRCIFPIIAVVCLSSFIYLLQQKNKTTSLEVMPISYDQLIEIDGLPNEPFWQRAKMVSVLTTGGANFANGQTQITVQAVANKEEVYFLFTWQDSTQSLQHLPLEKRNNQWQIKQQGFYQFDEQRYYEDKFAVMLSTHCESGADGTAHLGPQPIKDKPSNFHGKGYHASLDGRTRDLWHWKAVRTNDMFLADDNHFTSPKNVRTGERRYTAGYNADAKEGAGYVTNWQWYSAHTITPKRLPINADTFQQDKIVSNLKILPWFESTPYKLSNDNYAEGSVIPSVLYRSNRFEGDRADVRARGQWQAGKWTLELSRKRDTGSTYDIFLQNNVCLWVSAFDHSQIAHTRHERPFKLVFSSW